ncbi:hypothetical protein CXG81DRAFT_28146 [Caulochytrium protostelioides]|uniref:Transketolase-like pyrimidine-binding domain-containing protein n=2 Tax=Caulochytrium protostelioides TaxID=1555241 RepID=A0A4P9WZP1_9FUNG|nr:hypothetical protein CXG81DRAFT_28146 [Caulochytrium protostelioides]|eukprot:RKO99059.1 hypothetical protein CXG81DRAFT_28146 [Caulochytrium protostelioides]
MLSPIRHAAWHLASWRRAALATAACRPDQSLATATLRRQSAVPGLSALGRRGYHYDKDVYGYRVPKVFQMDDYTPAELANRTANAALLRLVTNYREFGHKHANLDPLNVAPETPVLALEAERILGSPLAGRRYDVAGIIHMPPGDHTIEAILTHLQEAYCDKIAFEFQHIPDASERRWFAQMVESSGPPTAVDAEAKKRIFALLARSEVFDHFMAKRFPSVKRYGLEGAESMIVLLDALFHAAGSHAVHDVIVGMPHRGRLNLLTDLLQFDPVRLFHKLKGNAEFPDDVPGVGDVLSHVAQSVDLDYGTAHPVHVSLLHNPSHLEAVNPVAMGKARARQMALYEAGTEAAECTIGDRVMCVQLHGDSAFTGQGVVTETLGLSNLPHFTSGGSIHLIVNNQIGYTTPAMNSRSSAYTSDVAKMINSPVIHVNADFPEAVARAASLAMAYRHKFRKDIVIDMIAYRRMGHNELDEPAFTQPLMYRNIRSRKSVPRTYEAHLKHDGIMTADEIDAFRAAHFQHLDEANTQSAQYTPKADTLQSTWAEMTIARTADTTVDTGVPVDQLRQIGEGSVAVPPGFELHSRLKKFHVDNRLKSLAQGTRIDWATAEALAFGSLLLDGYHVRISGQDVGRGTFSQRHVMLVDQETERTLIPLNHLTRDHPPAMPSVPHGLQQRGKMEIANSSLSEFAVLGFEYGVSWETPQRLCIWEAQFGDFFNGAQIIIDTFIASGEAKWLRQSGLVMLLPHGLDGAGPEHSTCRIERFLQLADTPFALEGLRARENPNLQVVYPTTPAQIFHLLRRQMVRPYRKPLVVAGPKMLLRHPLASSTLAEMAPGTRFQPLLDEADGPAADPARVKRLVLLSGKLYYDLFKERAQLPEAAQGQVRLVRVEELAPFPLPEIERLLEQHAETQDIVWLQEEAQNQGAWTYVEPRLRLVLQPGQTLRYAGRAPSSVPATGITNRYKTEQKQVLASAFEGLA